MFTAPCNALAGPWAAVWAHGSTLGPAWAAKASWAAWVGCGVGSVAIVHLGGTRVGCQILNVTKTATKPAGGRNRTFAPRPMDKLESDHHTVALTLRKIEKYSF